MFLQDPDVLSGDAFERYSSPPVAMLSCFYMMLGMADVADFQQTSTITIFVCFMIFIELVMLNMLIAIMVRLSFGLTPHSCSEVSVS